MSNALTRTRDAFCSYVIPNDAKDSTKNIICAVALTAVVAVGYKFLSSAVHSEISSASAPARTTFRHPTSPAANAARRREDNEKTRTDSAVTSSPSVAAAPAAVARESTPICPNPLILEQQRQILELQKQALELQLQQRKETASLLEAKGPIIHLQLEEINRRQSVVDREISSLEHQMHVARSSGRAVAAEKELERHRRVFLEAPRALAEEVAQYQNAISTLERLKEEKSVLQTKKKMWEDQLHTLLQQK